MVMERERIGGGVCVCGGRESQGMFSNCFGKDVEGWRFTESKTHGKKVGAINNASSKDG